MTGPTREKVVPQMDRLFIGDGEYVRADEAVQRVCTLAAENAALREKLEAAEAERDAALAAEAEYRRKNHALTDALTTARAEGAAAGFVMGRDAAAERVSLLGRLVSADSATGRATERCLSVVRSTPPPADLIAALDEVRRQERAAGRKAGLLEAAKVADHYAEMDYCAIGYPEDGGIAASGTADTIRRDIRALAEQGGEA